MFASAVGVFSFLVATSVCVYAGELPWYLGPINEDFLPTCTFKDLKAKCCANTLVLHNEMCVEIELSPDHQKAKTTLFYLGHQFMQKDVALGDFCQTKADVCLRFYYVDINPQDQSMEVCVQGSVSTIAAMDFKCLKYQNGKFSHNSDHKPPGGKYQNV